MKPRVLWIGVLGEGGPRHRLVAVWRSRVCGLAGGYWELCTEVEREEVDSLGERVLHWSSGGVDPANHDPVVARAVLHLANLPTSEDEEAKP